VLRATLHVAERAEREPGSARVASVIDHGAIGVEATLAALQQGRVYILVYADGFGGQGSECPRCHALFAAGAGPTCAYRAERLSPLDDLVGRAIERAAESGGTIEKAHGEVAARLLRAGGIGAITRF
jgi:peptide subunit release factor 1 (eRF1)